MPLRAPSPCTAALLLCIGLWVPATTAHGQALVIDEGTFSLFRGNERIGREDFGIRRTRGAGGGAYLSQGNILLGEDRRAVVLNVDSVGRPMRVQVETRRDGRLVQSVQGERDRGLWSARIAREVGESARELRLPTDVFVLEAGIAHLTWFVLGFGEGRPITILSPSDVTQQRVIVQEQTPDRVSLGLRELVARRWTIRHEGTGNVIWEVWTDRGGRLLRVIDRTTGVEALRDDPPAETRAPS